MKKIRCIVIDDEPLAIDLLTSYIEKTHFLEMVFSTTNPLEALQFLAKETVDLVFLDIQMPELSGIDFMKILSGKNNFILTTAYSNYALDSYEYNVIDYLLKPISFERFYKSILKFKDRISTNAVSAEEKLISKDYFFVKQDGRFRKINFEDILYIESLKDYVNIKTQDEEIIILETLKDLEENLPNNFMRVHKSYIANLNKISLIEGNRIRIEENYILIGDKYKSIFFDWIRNQN